MTLLLGIISISFTLISTVITDMTGHIWVREYSSINQFPHSVFLKTNAPHNMSRCGASLITQSIILTAGKCFYVIRKPYDIVVSMGNEQEALGQLRRVINFIIHENYTDVIHANDIALGLLDKPVEFGWNVRRVALMRTPPYYEPAFMAGWGWINDNEKLNIYLKHTSQHLAEMHECHRVFGPGRIAKGTICMENRFYNTRANIGDTGNALIVSGFIQIGIVSWGDMYKSYSKIIYTNTSYHYDWIMTQATKLYCRYQERYPERKYD